VAAPERSAEASAYRGVVERTASLEAMSVLRTLRPRSTGLAIPRQLGGLLSEWVAGARGHPGV